MEVLNRRSALLSNFEVLSLLQELENEHLARTKTAQRIKKEEEGAAANGGAPPRNADAAIVESSENLRTVAIEAIQHLTADFQPTAGQSAAGIKQLVQALAPYGLTKAEKLQIVNLAPTEAVELYVIVEELEDRLGTRMDEILEHVRASLAAVPTTSAASAAPVAGADSVMVATEGGGWDEYDDAEGDADGEIVGEVEFDDTGEGAGVEGDLDMEDD